MRNYGHPLKKVPFDMKDYERNIGAVVVEKFRLRKDDTSTIIGVRKDGWVILKRNNNYSYSETDIEMAINMHDCYTFLDGSKFEKELL